MTSLKIFWKDWWVGLFLVFMILSLTAGLAAGIVGVTSINKSKQSKWLELIHLEASKNIKLTDENNKLTAKVKHQERTIELITMAQPKPEEIHPWIKS